MARSKRGSRPSGYDCWSSRPQAYSLPGRFGKKLGFKPVSIFYVKDISNVKITSSVAKWQSKGLRLLTFFLFSNKTYVYIT